MNGSLSYQAVTAEGLNVNPRDFITKSIRSQLLIPVLDVSPSERWCGSAVDYDGQELSNTTELSP